MPWRDARRRTRRSDDLPVSNNADLLAAALLREQPLAGVARRRADGASARAGRRADLSRSADGRRVLPLHPPRADRCDRDVRPGVRPRLRRGKRFMHAGCGCRVSQRAVRGCIRPAPGRQLVRRQARRSGRTQHANPARSPSAVPRAGARLHRRRSGAPVARAGAVAVPGAERTGPGSAPCHPRSWRRDRIPCARADRRLRPGVSPLSADRRRRRMAARGARQRCHADVRFQPPASRAVERFSGRHLRTLWRRPDPPSQHFRLPRRFAAGALPPRHAFRLHGARSQLRLPDDNLPQCAAPLLRCGDRRCGLHRLPCRAARVRRRRHRRWQRKHRALLARSAF